MKKHNLLSLFFVCLLFNLDGYSQTNPRLKNRNYMKTIFLEDFNDSILNRNIWHVEANWKRNLAENIWVDDTNTVSQRNGNLRLSMISRPGYTTIWNGKIFTADYIAGEIKTDTAFRYGSFECSAKFAYANGSFPAFWIMGGDGTACPPGGYGSEIDIAELNCEDPVLTIDHVIHRYYPPTDCDVSNVRGQDFMNYFDMSFDNNYHLYKCIWGPDRIDYYVDGAHTHQVFNTGQEWYPNLSLSIILSQQVIDPLGAIISPQTSYFDYVRVKQFFLAPEITCPSVICTTGTATMDVASEATNISWQLTPSSLFTNASGRGSTANIVASNGANGFGKITYSFQMSIGETFTAEKIFWVGIPPIPEISSFTPFVWSTSYWPTPVKIYTVYTGEEIDFSDENINTYGVLIQDLNWTWNIEAGGTTYDAYDYGTGGKMCFFHQPGSVRIRVQASNSCDEADWSEPVFVEVIQQEYLLSFLPNPVSDEATIELKSSKQDQSFKAVEWEMEIYDTMQSMKAKVSKIKGKSVTVNTSDWKDGIYVVRAKIDSKILTQKLVVKH